VLDAPDSFRQFVRPSLTNNSITKLPIAEVEDLSIALVEHISLHPIHAGLKCRLTVHKGKRLISLFNAMTAVAITELLPAKLISLQVQSTSSDIRIRTVSRS
jgi:hypothetical protein